MAELVLTVAWGAICIALVCIAMAFVPVARVKIAFRRINRQAKRQQHWPTARWDDREYSRERQLK